MRCITSTPGSCCFANMAMVRNGVCGTDELLGMMDWNRQDPQQLDYQTDGCGGLFVKVMTDEQMELLRRQISAYASICEQLVEMHKAITAQQDLAAEQTLPDPIRKSAPLPTEEAQLPALHGMRLGNMYCDSLMTSAGHKITARQRWTPTPMQLEILEHVFDEGTGTPSKHRIKEITAELLQHGQISETNVYTWFQNRRARSKRKQLTGVQSNAESEAEAEVESPKEKKTKPEDMQSHENSAPRAENIYIQSPDLSDAMDYLAPNKGDMFLSDCGLRSSGSMGHLALYETVPRMDHFIGKMETPGSFSSYQQGGGYEFVE